MKLFKFNVFYNGPHDKKTVTGVDGREYEGILVTVLAPSVEEAKKQMRAFASEHRCSDGWIDVVTPEEIPLTQPRVVGWTEL